MKKFQYFEEKNIFYALNAKKSLLLTNSFDSTLNNLNFFHKWKKIFFTQIMNFDPPSKNSNKRYRNRGTRLMYFDSIELNDFLMQQQCVVSGKTMTSLLKWKLLVYYRKKRRKKSVICYQIWQAKKHILECKHWADMWKSAKHTKGHIQSYCPHRKCNR